MVLQTSDRGARRVGAAALAVLVLLVGAVALVWRGEDPEHEGRVDGAAAAAGEPAAVERVSSGAAAGGDAPEPVAAGPSAAGPAEIPSGPGRGVAAPMDDTRVPEADVPLPPLGEDVFPAEPAPRVRKPAAVRGVYVNAWSAGSRRKMARLMALADSTEINAFVIDVKDATGYVSYRTGVALARQVGADRDIRIRDVRGLLDSLRERGIYPIARIVVFKDPLLARKKPEWSIQKADGTTWVDHNGELWVDSFNRDIWDYAIALAREAVLLGFSEVQWDYVRFPDVPQRYMKTAVFPAREGRTKEDAIREFLQYSRERLSDLGVPVTADVFGLTVSAPTDMGIGQRWEKMVDATDVLLPMVYPSHFAKGSYGIPIPNADPYQTVKTAMEYAVERTEGVERPASIRPWLQDFSLGWPSYGAAEVRAQIQATYDAGLEEWVLWNPASNYTVAALAPEGGEAPELPIPVHRPQITIQDSLPLPRVDGVAGPALLGVPAERVKRLAPPRDTTGGL